MSTIVKIPRRNSLFERGLGPLTFKKEVADWLDEVVGINDFTANSPWRLLHRYRGSSDFIDLEIKDPNKALLFKLTWGGDIEIGSS